MDQTIFAHTDPGHTAGLVPYVNLSEEGDRAVLTVRQFGVSSTSSMALGDENLQGLADSILAHLSRKRAAAAGRPEFQQRVIEEHEQLEARLTKLVEFLGSGKRAGIGCDQLFLILQQAAAMTGYAKTLGHRIRLFDGHQEMAVFSRGDGHPSEFDPMGMEAVQVAIPAHELGRVGVPKLGLGQPQRVHYCKRGELPELFPKAKLDTEYLGTNR